jgi:uncharacterized UBP type Zn finger protein
VKLINETDDSANQPEAGVMTTRPPRVQTAEEQAFMKLDSDVGLPISSDECLCGDVTPVIHRLKWIGTARAIGSGLSNLGQTCYMNSVLQCLAYSPPFAQILLHETYPMKSKSTAVTKNKKKNKQEEETTNYDDMEEINLDELWGRKLDNVSGGVKTFDIIKLLRNLMNEMHQVSNNKVVTPDELVSNIRAISRQFRIGRPEDAHEFLVCYIYIYVCTFSYLSID